MKTMLAALAFAIAVPAAAHAAEGAMEKCCCEKMKHEGKDCCADEADKAGDHAGHGEHAGHEMPAPQAPAN